MGSSGIVIVTEFCTAEDSTFKDYISYIDRDEAVIKNVIAKYSLFNEYMEYMDDTEKTSGLFTDKKSTLNEKEKKQLKSVFETAQKNDSLMWQTVISFDNDYLKEQGIYDPETKRLDENKLQAATRTAMNELLSKEGLTNAVYSAAIHYNTDNIHVHVATVEPIPTRQKKLYNQWEKEKIDGKIRYKQKICPLTGKKEKIPVLDPITGEQLVKKEYVGIFKNDNVKAAKAKVRATLESNKETTVEINMIIRDNILGHLKKNDLYVDSDFREQYERLHQDLALRGKSGMWNYNQNLIADLKPEIDELSRKYIEKYHKDDFKRLEVKLEALEKQYQRAYGKSNDYAAKKIDELYMRMGNSILKNIKDYNRDIQINKINAPEAEVGLPDEEENMKNENIDDAMIEIGEADEHDYATEDTFMDWSMEYKEARRYLYKTKDYDKALILLNAEASKGNVLAMFDVGNIYKNGIGVKISLEKADTYYRKAFRGFNKLYKTDMKNQEFLAYRIGKMHKFGLGTDEDILNAKKWFEGVPDNIYAQYSLGNIFYNGVEGKVDIDYEKALRLYKSSNTSYANYKIAQMYSNGVGVETDVLEAVKYYEKALGQFLSMEKDDMADDNLFYRIGCMYMNGQGTEVDEEKGVNYLTRAAEEGNANAQYKLGKYYISNPDATEDKIKLAMNLLKEAATKGKNDLAQYALGKIYNDVEYAYYDKKEAVSWFELSAAQGNEYAQYNLGKIYAESNDSEYFNMAKAVSYFELSATQGNEYAQYNLGKVYAESNDSEYFNMAKAVSYFELSATQGNEYAQYNLGKVYAESNDSEYFNMAKAVSYFELSAAQGNEYAQYNLGKIYAESNDSEYFNMVKAIHFFKLAAAHDNEFANNKLGMIFLKGEFVERDIDAAKAYFEKSAEKNNEFAVRMLENINKSQKNMYQYDNRSSHLKQALQWLKRSLCEDCEKALNLKEYQELQQQIKTDQETEM